MIHHIEIDYSKRSSPGTLTIICSARGRILYQAKWIYTKKRPAQRELRGQGGWTPQHTRITST